jgi:hypothetical protein
MLIHALIPVTALITTLDIAPRQVEPASWQAWHGCWEASGEAVVAGHLLCVLPGSDASEVRLVTFAGGVLAGETRMRADGSARSVEEGGCTGTEQARWSADGRRIFVATRLDCDGRARVSRGVMAIISEEEWVDIQAATIFDQHLTRTLRYRHVPAGRAPESVRALLDDSRSLVRQTARMAAAAPLTIEDVVEATSQMPAAALQALLAARGTGFDLKGRTLLALADAGVAPEVIDVMVGLSYPSRFAVRQPVPVTTDAPRRVGSADSCFDRWTGRIMYGFDCDFAYSLSARQGWYGYSSPWAYNRYGGWYGGGTTVIVVQPREPDAPRPQPGQMIRGSGYTRGTGSSTTGTAQPRSATSSSGAGGSAPASATTGTSGSSTSTGTSSTGASGSSGTATGRTAQPRTTGGGGGN